MADMNENVDAMFEELLGSPISDTASNDELQSVIQKARAAETKAKVQIYTMRGKKGLEAAMAAEKAAMEQEQAAAAAQPSVCDELRASIQRIRDEEAQIQREIAELKKAKEERLRRAAEQQGAQRAAPVAAAPVIAAPQVIEQPAYTAPQIVQQPAYTAPQIVQQPAYTAPQIVQQPAYTAPQIVQQPSYTAPVVEAAPPAQAQNSFLQQPTVTATPALVDTASTDNVSSSFLVNSKASVAPEEAAAATAPVVAPATKSKKSKKDKNAAFAGPSSVAIQVLSVTWDSGSAKSKKSNKVYTIQVSMNNITWKIIRGDDVLADFGKKMKSQKAELQSFPSLAKKVVKKEQQGELANAVTAYLNAINLDVVFKRDKYKQPYLKFFAPFGAKDEGLGSFPGSHADVEPWYLWKLGLE